MARFGAGMNPQLGAVDYTPYLQGALQGAQMQAQGAAAIGQGLANLGQQVGQGVQQYFQNKQIAATAIADFEGAAQTNPKLLAVLTSEGAPQEASKAFKKLQKEGSVGVKDAAVLSAFAKSYILGEERAAAAQQQQLAAEREQFINAPLAAGAPFANPSMAVAEYLRRGGKADVANAFINAQPKRPDKAVDPVSFRSMDAQGNPIEVTVDRLTNSVIAQGPVREAPRQFRTAQEEADAAALTTEAKSEAESAVKFLDTIAEQAAFAQQNAPKFARLRELLQSPRTNTGALEEYRTAVRALAVQLGAKDATLADQQAMEALLAEDALLETRRLLSGQGAVTEAERARIDKLALSANRSPEALLELLGLRDAAVERSLAAEDRRLELIEQGVRPRDAQKIMRRWMRDNPLSAFIPAGDAVESENVVQSAFDIVNRNRKK